ncbi:MAG: hypothetical protein M1823_005004 [Watsoniomyces obsoletus]|nr:MAG: hypothetical protein M1823_005004 [Watsoniomyces obsoletus]
MSGRGKKPQRGTPRRGSSSTRGGGRSETSGSASASTAPTETSRRPMGLDGADDMTLPLRPAAPAKQGSGTKADPPSAPSPGPASETVVGSHAPSVASKTPSEAGASSSGAKGAAKADEGPPTAKNTNRRLDLPADAYNMDKEYDVPAVLPRRGAQWNTSGKPVTMRLNSWPVTKFPDQTIWQYDVLIGSGIEMRALIRKVWNSQALQKELGPSWIFDGNRLAWSADQKTDMRVDVDLDLEEDRKPRPGRSNVHRVLIRRTTQVHMAALSSWLSGQAAFDQTVLQAMNFLDHLLRHTPSQALTTIRQSYFLRESGSHWHDLGSGVGACKGVFQSIRAHQGARLAINADVAHACFWHELNLLDVAIHMAGARDAGDLKRKLEPELEQPGKGFHLLRLLKRIQIVPRYSTISTRRANYTINEILRQTAEDYEFDVHNKETGEMERTTVANYYQKRYGIQLKRADFPLLQTTKKGVVFPMEVVVIRDMLRYPYKLDEAQTSKMIRFAVNPPEARLADIEKGIRALNWAADPMHKAYGLQISNKMAETTARLLPPPKVQYRGTSVDPGTRGHWDLRGPKRFWQSNPVTLQYWGVGVFPSRNPSHTVGPATLSGFLNEFIRAYKGHGGLVDSKLPFMMRLESDPAKGVEQLWTKTMAHYDNKRPQMLMFIVSDRTSFHYFRIKRSCECRFGVVSQCLQAMQVSKSGNGQYLSNICMKINAKLGGSTARAAHKNNDWGHFLVPTMVIGADVSHAPGGSDQASTAAMTMSMDKLGLRYAAACETNGRREEIISEENIHKLLPDLVKHWAKNVNAGNLPNQIFYFRDGVSEAQFQHVLKREVPHLRAMLAKISPTWKRQVKFLVVVASKRHHFRFFPKSNDKAAGDQKQNPLPGTLVEKTITHPFDNDFYLCSHKAIQGTARPVHYTILLDEVGMSINQLHALIYEQCYAYMRSTTPVSLHPAIYYAHLASNRSRCHDRAPISQGARSGPDMPAPTIRDPSEAELPPVQTLKPMADLEKSGLDKAMWYI